MKKERKGGIKHLCQRLKIGETVMPRRQANACGSRVKTRNFQTLVKGENNLAGHLRSVCRNAERLERRVNDFFPSGK